MSMSEDLHRLKNRALARVYTPLPSLTRWWGTHLAQDEERIPWVEAAKPLHLATVALVTTGGVHLATQAAFDMEAPDGDATWREIPVGTPASALAITHDYYDHRDADRDPNLVLPTERLLELEAMGAVGRVHRTAYSFMGHIDGERLGELVQSSAPAVATRLRDAAVDYALLVPA